VPSAAEPRRADAFVVTMVTDGGAAGADAAALVARVVAAARAGVDVVQVREKALTDRALLGLVSAVRAGLASSATRLLVNGRPDVAVWKARETSSGIRSALSICATHFAIGPNMWR